jgi:ectoine hydroxylase-related dioxygenase (phytanoyl-CoA dioxygenase family)
MTTHQNIPQASYGILTQDQFESEFDEVAEQVRRLGFATVDSGFTQEELANISAEFERTRSKYVGTWGTERLKSLNEIHTIRAPLTHGGPEFMQLAMNPNLLSVLKKLIQGKFILNQQNGVINPPNETYNQGAWHRDLPYQHYVSSSPLAVNALFCVDDFTRENGSTFVLPASHKTGSFPSDSYIRRNAVQVEARAGQYILLDCMLFHSGGFNQTNRERRAVNHIYNIPYFKQQINLPENLSSDGLSQKEMEILGFRFQEPRSIEKYLASRMKTAQQYT